MGSCKKLKIKAWGLKKNECLRRKGTGKLGLYFCSSGGMSVFYT